MKADISVKCEPGPDGGWACEVQVRQRGVTHHEVDVSAAELERWGAGGDAADLVRRSFEFLLDREPASSVLRHFKIGDISRYFPEFDAAMAPDQKS